MKGPPSVRIPCCWPCCCFGHKKVLDEEQNAQADSSARSVSGLKEISPSSSIDDHSNDRDNNDDKISHPAQQTLHTRGRSLVSRDVHNQALSDTDSQAADAINTALRFPSPARSLDTQRAANHSARVSMDTLEERDKIEAPPPTYEKAMNEK